MVAPDFFSQGASEPPASAPPPPTTDPPRRRFRPALAGAAIALALAGGASGGFASNLLSSKDSSGTAPTGATTNTSTTSTTSTSSSATSSVRSSAESIYQAVSPSVVTIQTTINGRFGSVGQGTGSGIVIDSKGDILTNYHVVQGAQQLQVTFSDGTTATGNVVGTNSGHDLAIVRVSVSSSKLHPATLGNSSSLEVGDSVYAIGSPYGLSGSLSQGIVSGLNRTGSSSTSSNGLGDQLTGLIQTDAAINPGNSGGALVNSSGQVIGVNQSIESPVDGNVGVGFAIPINQVKSLLSSLEGGSNL